MRDSLREKDLLKDYLEEHPYSQAYRFIQKQPGVTYESMRNYLDVSVVGVALHSPPLEFWASTSVHLELGARMLGLGLGNRGPIPRGEVSPTSSSWSVGTESSYDQMASKCPFQCQGYVIEHL